jgi:hypothetical protein
MAKAYTFTARVEEGRLKVSLRALELLRAAVHGWQRCPVTVTIEKQHATRSLNANAYYWGVIVQHIAEHTGYTPEETHDVLKTMFLPKRLAMLGKNGELHQELVIGGSTTALNKIEFYEYCERIRDFARQKLGVAIPTPEQSEAA